MALPRMPMVQWLVQKGYLKPEQLDEAQKVHQQSKGELGRILVDLGYVGEREVMEARAQEAGIPFVDLDRQTIDSSAINVVQERVVKNHNVIPVRKEGNVLYVATSNLANIQAQDDIRMASGLRVAMVLALPGAIEDAIRKYYGGSQGNGQATGATAAAAVAAAPANFSTDIRSAIVKLDTEGEPLTAGLRAGPAAVTPNASEAEGAVGHEFNDRDDLLAGLRELVELGAGEALVTKEEGCVASLLDGSERKVYEVTAPALEPIAAVGSGDAFLAGFTAARFDGRPPDECARFAVACGAESTQHFGAGTIDPDEVDRLASQVEVKSLDPASAVR